MARRITHKTPDSLKLVKQKEGEVKASIATAERQAAEVGKHLGTMRTQEEVTEKRLEELDEIYGKELAKRDILDAKIADMISSVRELEGKHANKLAELTDVEIQIQKAVSEQAEAIVPARKEHLSQMVAYEKVQSEIQQVIAGQERRKATLITDIESVTDEVDGMRKQANKLNQTVKLIPVKQKELEDIETLVLQKLVEQQDSEVELSKVIAQQNDVRVKLDELKAFCQIEEERIEKLQKQLVEKEDDVDKKMKQMKEIKDGVTQATTRLERRQKDFDLKQHLANSKSDVTKK